MSRNIKLQVIAFCLLLSLARAGSSVKHYKIFANGSVAVMHENLEDFHDRRLAVLASASQHELDAEELLFRKSFHDNIESTKANYNSKTPLACKGPFGPSQFDHLEGVAKRRSLKSMKEAGVALIFDHYGGLVEAEANLKKSLAEHPNNAALINEAGNYWRVKGDTFQAVECFRKALFYTPNNADVLLNLARVMLNMGFSKDAAIIMERALQLVPNSFLHHFTHGEVMMAMGKWNSAAESFRKTLELHPYFQPAESHLQELQKKIGPTGTTHIVSTYLVIGCCSLVTLIVVYMQLLKVPPPPKRDAAQRKPMALHSHSHSH
eukprot:Colp12_sorted_trinity150504_noHs@29575